MWSAIKPQLHVGGPVFKEATIAFGGSIKGLENKRIIYVDDMPTARLVMQKLLQQYGVNENDLTLLDPTGKTADNIVGQMRKIGFETIDLILLDMQWSPQATHAGWQAYQKLREQGYTGPMALYSSSFSPDAENIRGTSVISKELEDDVLIQRIIGLVN